MKSKIKKILVVSSIVFGLLPFFALASDTGTPNRITIPNPSSKLGGDLLTAVNAILNNVILPIGAVICVIFIIYAGFTFVTAQGKPAEITKAQQRLLWALIGTGILLGAVGISNAVQLTIKALFPGT
jgi:hypothetical protein